MTIGVTHRPIWHLAIEVGSVISSHLAPTIRHYKSEVGLNGWTWFTLLQVFTLGPEPATLARLQMLDPYSSPQRFLPHLSVAVAKGYLARTAEGYHLTTWGSTEVGEFVDDLRLMMVAVDPLPSQHGDRLAVLLDRLVQASLVTVPTSAPGAIQHSFRLLPGRVPPLPFIEQAISCLAAYRDDSHLAAWLPSGLTPPALESLTYLWRGNVHSLEALHRHLVRRAHLRQTYGDALQELRQRDFVAGPDEEVRITETGRAFRQQVEAETDHLFFAPWSCLHPSELDELADLLTQAREGLLETNLGGK